MSGPPTRVFLARLAGVPVFDPTGDQVGKIRDTVVAFRSSSRPPRVLGLVVEMQPRRLIFLPLTRVTNIESDAVIFTGSLSMRRFQQRSTETLVLGELLDRKVTHRDSDATVTVLDVAMERTRTRDWAIAKIAVRRPGKRLRRGETSVVDWDAVTGFGAHESDQGAESLLATFDELRPADLAHVMHELSPKRRAEVATALGDERLADVMEELSSEDQVEVVGKLDAERAADVLEAMDPDDAADLLHVLPLDRREQLLRLMEPEEAAPVRRLLRYADDSAGGMMTTEPVILAPDATVAEALARIRNPDLSLPLGSQVYVCRPPTDTPSGKYLGLVYFQRLLREPPASLVSGVMDSDLMPLRPETQLHDVASHFAMYNLTAVPVVDENDHMLGAVTVDDVLDHMLPEDWRDRVPMEQEQVRGG
ncbi:MAG: CBS domain-containing protein [Streptosporangiales bacterium]|nr:CBS domain-containing protein [Streptosporangiales bacterium]